MGCDGSVAQKFWNATITNTEQNSPQNNTVANTQNAQSSQTNATQQPSSVSTPTESAPVYPFVGQRSFNFMGGNGTEMIINISPDGNTKIKFCGVFECINVYKGKYMPIMPIGDGEYVKFSSNRAYLLNSSKKAITSI